jgi:DNA polymerase lambda
MFDGLRFYVLSGHGADLRSTRAILLKKQLKSHKAVLVEDSASADVLIASAHCPCAVLNQHQSCPVQVSPNWVSESILAGRKLPYQGFLLRDLKEIETESRSVDSLEEDPRNQKEKLDSILDQRHACEALGAVNLNANISTVFEELEHIYSALGDKWREYTYKKAAGIIKRLSIVIETEDDVQSLHEIRGLGTKLVDKVREIVRTGSLQKLQNLKADPKITTLCTFAQVWGAGASTASRWASMGFKTLGDLEAVSDEQIVNRQQRIGLRYFEDFGTRIPRAEVELIAEKVRQALDGLLPGCQVVICGSYRRGNQTCGDVDLLVTHENEEKLQSVLRALISNLSDSGFLTDHLAMPSEACSSCGQPWSLSYMGVCCLDDSHRHRRIDIKVYPQQVFAFALLHFTGSEHFCRSIRHLAKKKGWTLSDLGISKVIRVNKQKVWKGESSVCLTEQAVFDLLGLAYVAPEQRNIFPDIR